MQFEGKVILVTGASSGLGKGLVQALARYPVTLVIVARRHDLLEVLKRDVEALGNSCLALQADMLDPGQAAGVVAQSVAAYGRIDLAIHCVGGGRPLPLEAASAEQLLSAMSNNYGTLVNLFVPLLKQLRQQTSPSVVVHLNSLAYIVEIPRGAHYSAAKVAAQRFFDTARIELRDSPIRLVTLNPGFVQTENKKQKMMLGISLERAVTLMLRAIAKEKPSYSFPWPLVVLFKLISLLPRGLRGRILARLSDRESGKYTE